MMKTLKVTGSQVYEILKNIPNQSNGQENNNITSKIMNVKTMTLIY